MVFGLGLHSCAWVGCEETAQKIFEAVLPDLLTLELKLPARPFTSTPRSKHGKSWPMRISISASDCLPQHDVGSPWCRREP